MGNTIRTLSRADAESILQKLIGCPLCYGIKSPDMEFFDIGYGECDIIQGWNNRKRFINSFVIHASCPIKIFERENKKRSIVYSGDSLCEEFHNEMEHLMGLTVKRISLSEKHDLWIDMGKYWLVCITYEDEKESWRFFSPIEESGHLVATHRSIETSE